MREGVRGDSYRGRENPDTPGSEVRGREGGGTRRRGGTRSGDSGCECNRLIYNSHFRLARDRPATSSQGLRHGSRLGRNGRCNFIRRQDDTEGCTAGEVTGAGLGLTMIGVCQTCLLEVVYKNDVTI